MKTIQTTIPDQLDRDIDSLVEQGWFESREQVLQEALRRFLKANQPSLMERFARDDLEWGLHGHK